MDSTIVTLRPAREDERQFLLSVYASTRTEELACVTWGPGELQQFLEMQFTAQDRYYRENYAGAEFLVIEVDGRPAGRLYLHRREREIRIMDISLLPAFRNRGIGSSLLREVLAEGRRAGRKVSIHVEVNNPAMRLYRRLGFETREQNGIYLLMEWLPRMPAAAQV
jgi:ribosomal protein S18 acetylase RimI-like enzyme